jgi:hypothetical protein
LKKEMIINPPYEKRRDDCPLKLAEDKEVK